MDGHGCECLKELRALELRAMRPLEFLATPGADLEWLALRAMCVEMVCPAELWVVELWEWPAKAADPIIRVAMATSVWAFRGDCIRDKPS